MYRQGVIVEVSFDPTRGHEPAKRRPALVVSSDAFNMRSSLAFLAPVTSTDNGYPLHVRVGEGCAVRGFVCIEQIRSVDLEARPCRKIGEMPEETMCDVLNLIGPVFGI